jgi:hypothetical protein
MKARSGSCRCCMFHGVESTLQTFHDAGIRTMLLKGAALTLLSYRDYGLRPMTDFDVAIPEPDVPRALGVLHKLGWGHITGKTGADLEHMLAASHSTSFFNGERRLDLHSRIGFNFWRHALPDPWKDSVPLQLNSIQTASLHPTDMLIHVCVHGFSWNPVPPLRWIADAAVLLQAESALDWASVLARAKEAHLTLPLYMSLHYLQALLDLDIPASVMRDLQTAPVSLIERVRMNIALRPLGVPSNLLLHYDRYYNVRRVQNLPPSLLGFMRYLQQVWGVDHVWQTPLHGVRRISRFVRGVYD